MPPLYYVYASHKVNLVYTCVFLRSYVAILEHVHTFIREPKARIKVGLVRFVSILVIGMASPFIDYLP